MPDPIFHEQVAGCLLGGAVGDALGAPVEFLSLPEIRHVYGPDGIVELDAAYGRVGAITDDTQMTLFTAEGLLRAICREQERGECQPASVVHHAYVRWLHTQGERSASHWVESWKGGKPDGWLTQVRALHSRRGPGTTCLMALWGGEMGTPTNPLNHSKGCGGVMRIAPVGLIQPAGAFELGCEIAAITHGHPSGYLAAGCMAHIVARITEGATLQDAVLDALERLERERGHEECSRAIRMALRAADAGSPSADIVESLGGGWVAEEALAIAIYCALVAEDDFERAIRLAVNHSGDSDSTGAITGNLLGTLLGVRAIPERWLAELELRKEIATLAEDLCIGYREGKEWRRRYPGW